MKSIPAIAVIAACSGGGTNPGTDNDASIPRDVAASDTTVMPPATYAVGVTTRTYVDTSRPTPANGTAPMMPQRTLTTEIWYPAPIGTPGPETMNAPLASGGPFPLVVFVHGSNGWRRQSTYLTQGLAAAGYVVMAADFPLTWMGTPGGESELHIEDETGDVKFLADQATAFTADPSDALHGSIDPQAGYSVVGHSSGGAVAYLMAFGDAHDPRVRASVPLSGDSCFFADGFFRTRSVPVLLVTGTRDLLVPQPDNTKRAYDLAGAPKAFASLVGGFHMGFSDIDIPDEALHAPPLDGTFPIAMTLAKYGNGAGCVPVQQSSDPDMDFMRQHALTLQVVSAYLDRTIRGLGTPLPSGPDIVVEHSP